MPGHIPTSPTYYSRIRRDRASYVLPVSLAVVFGTLSTAFFCWQGLVQYAVASTAWNQTLQAPMGLPGALPGAYRIAVIAVTCVGGFLMLLSMIMALFSRERRTSFAGDGACCSGMLCMQRATATLLYIYVGLIVLLACIQAIGTVYLWDAKYSVDHIYQTDSSGAGLQSGCTQLTLFAQSAAVCEGTNGPQLQSSLQSAVTHATCTLGGLVVMYLAFSMLMALSSSAAGRAAADHHFILEDPFGKAPSSPESPTDACLGFPWTYSNPHACGHQGMHASPPSAPVMPGYHQDA